MQQELEARGVTLRQRLHLLVQLWAAILNVVDVGEFPICVNVAWVARNRLLKVRFGREKTSSLQLDLTCQQVSLRRQLVIAGNQGQVRQRVLALFSCDEGPRHVVHGGGSPQSRQLS